ncbi:MAG: succinate--CoA ligase subunit alpha [Oscillospiraceae bacterium]|nr:succinate--CoA ligase subunit alpha [Oscillospiraceae bacterium]
MSVVIDENTRLIVQGITGREGAFHTERMLQYKTNVVAGVTPGKGGQMVCGVPVFDTVKEAVEQTDADASILFVPARYTPKGVREALDAGVSVIITIAEHVPAGEMMMCYHLAKAKKARLFGPNSFGIISPGKAKAGFMPHEIFTRGPVGIMSRSATNCYESVHMMSSAGLGQSTCIGVGGDMIPGSSFADLLYDFENDPETGALVLIGEIGGYDEELAAEYIKKNKFTKPVAAFIAGKNAPRGKTMGHAGAIVSPDGAGSAENKEKALSEAGCHIAQNTKEIAEILIGLNL